MPSHGGQARDRAAGLAVPGLDLGGAGGDVDVEGQPWGWRAGPTAPRMPGSAPSSVSSPRRRSVSSRVVQRCQRLGVGRVLDGAAALPEPSGQRPAPVSAGSAGGRRAAARRRRARRRGAARAASAASRRAMPSRKLAGGGGRGGQVDGHHVRAPGGRRSASPGDRPGEGRTRAARRRSRRARRARRPGASRLGSPGCGRPRPAWSALCARVSIASLSASTSPRCAASESAAVSCWAAAARRWPARSLMRSRIESAALPCHGDGLGLGDQAGGEGPDVAALLAQLGHALAAGGGVAVHRSLPSRPRRRLPSAPPCQTSPRPDSPESGRCARRPAAGRRPPPPTDRITASHPAQTTSTRCP